MNIKTKDLQHLSSTQYSSANKLHLRWNLYDFAIPKIDIHQAGINHLKLKGNERVLEVGCGDGNVLLNLRRHGHTEKLSGLEISGGMFKESVEVQAKEDLQPPIEFMVGSADNLPFPDKSFDVILAFFMLYHMPDTQKTLREWKRVLTDSGKILIATGSQFNKPKHQKFKKIAENLIGKKASPQFSSAFNLENGKEQLSETFQVVDELIYEGQIKIRKAQPYLDAFNSIRDMYEPIPSNAEWVRVERVVRAEIEEEIIKNGFFTDSVKRGFFVCQN